MGRVLGRVLTATAQMKYFIHNSTIGRSTRGLFLTPDEAWAAYEGSRSLRTSSHHGQEETTAEIVELQIESSRIREGFALADADRLLTPVNDDCDGDGCTLLAADGVVHVATETNAGFGGRWEAPVCEPTRPPAETDEVLVFEDAFGKPVTFCPKCLAILRREGHRVTVRTHWPSDN